MNTVFVHADVPLTVPWQRWCGTSQCNIVIVVVYSNHMLFILANTGSCTCTCDIKVPHAEINASFSAFRISKNCFLVCTEYICTHPAHGLCYLHVYLYMYVFSIQWSLYFKTTHGTKKMWSYIAGGLKIKVF